MRPLTIVQARMGSSRLPGKTLISVGGRTMLEWVLHRVALAGLGGPVVVATSVEKADEPVALFCREKRLQCFRGSHLDVLDRFYQCVNAHPDVDTIVRVTADCPLLCPTLLSWTAASLNGGAYAGVNSDCPEGFGQEAFTVDALHESWELATDLYDREHVVTYMLDRPLQFPASWLNWDAPRTRQRFTLDTGQDLVDLVRLFGRFGEGLLEMDSYEIAAAL